MSKTTTTLFFFILGVIFIFAVIAPTSVTADATDPEDIPCPLCLDFTQRVAVAGESPSRACRPKAVVNTNTATDNIFEACDFFWQPTNRPLIHAALKLRQQLRRNGGKNQNNNNVVIRSLCERHGMCPNEAELQATLKSAMAQGAGWDVRVSPASYLRPNSGSQVRVTVVIDNANDTDVDHRVFDYVAPFKYYWTNKRVRTGLFDVTPGKTTLITIPLAGNSSTTANLTLPVKLREQGAGKGIRFVAFGDPCISGEYVGCKHGAQWKIAHRMPELFNALAEVPKDTLDLMVLLGDAWYTDPTGDLAPPFFKSLTHRALGVPFQTVIGNHDYSRTCDYRTATEHTFGNGFFQFYGQDTLATLKNRSMPFDFSVNPHDPSKDRYHRLAAIENFVSYNMVGNILFLTYSGVYKQEDQMKYFQQGCDAVARAKPDWVFLINHWSEVNCGAAPNMDALGQLDIIATLTGCKDYAAQGRIIAVQGHSHRNKITRPGIALQCGGSGMSSADGANFGIPFFDSYEKRLEVIYFPIADARTPGNDPDGDAAWKALMDCVTTKGGLHQCRHLGETWIKKELP